MSFKKNSIVVNKVEEINSYVAADLAEFIRLELVNAGLSFTFETVMSYNGKLDFISSAKKQGYRIYLYFISTEDPSININRVAVRVAQKGHKVQKRKIRNRYYKSLRNLKGAVKLSDRAYLFDNSGKLSKLILEVTEGVDVHIIDQKDVPNWVIKYLID